MAELNHECGLCGVYLIPGEPLPPWVPADVGTQVSRLVPRMLLDLQNRGQLAAGMTGYNPTRSHLLTTYKELGAVNEAFRINHKEEFSQIMQ